MLRTVIQSLQALVFQFGQFGLVKFPPPRTHTKTHTGLVHHSQANCLCFFTCLSLGKPCSWKKQGKGAYVTHLNGCKKKQLLQLNQTETNRNLNVISSHYSLRYKFFLCKKYINAGLKKCECFFKVSDKACLCKRLPLSLIMKLTWKQKQTNNPGNSLERESL